MSEGDKDNLFERLSRGFPEGALELEKPKKLTQRVVDTERPTDPGRDTYTQTRRALLSYETEFHDLAKAVLLEEVSAHKVGEFWETTLEGDNGKKVLVYGCYVKDKGKWLDRIRGKTEIRYRCEYLNIGGGKDGTKISFNDRGEITDIDFKVLPQDIDQRRAWMQTQIGYTSDKDSLESLILHFESAENMGVSGYSNQRGFNVPRQNVGTEGKLPNSDETYDVIVQNALRVLIPFTPDQQNSV